MSRPPNILLIQCDQLAAAFLPAFGNPVADTPHINQLSRTGVCFQQAYSNFPLCAPSRFSMLSGRLASHIGAWDNGAEFPSSTPTLMHYLRHLGYHTCLSGKMHFVGADQLHGFEQRLTTDIYPADFGWTGDWTEAVMEQSNDDSSFRFAGVAERTVQMDYDEEVTHRACRYLYDAARADPGRPFFLTVSLTHPHDPYQCSPEHWSRYDHAAIDMPRVGRLELEAMDPYSRRLMRQYGLENLVLDDETIRTARHAYYGSISYLDDQVGKLLRVLGETGFADNTAVVFTSDHGDMLGERGLWYKKCFFENSIRVPLVIRLPGGESGSWPGAVSLLDLLPTLLELAGGADWRELAVAPVEGNSLADICRGATRAEPGAGLVYCEALAEGAGSAIVMIREGNFKYTAGARDPDMLFDLERDPLEMDNLAGHADHRETRDRLAAAVRAKWDLEELTRRVEHSQKQRIFIGKTLKTGRQARWDFTPADQAEAHCLRNDRTYRQWAYDDPLNPRRKP